MRPRSLCSPAWAAPEEGEGGELSRAERGARNLATFDGLWAVGTDSSVQAAGRFLKRLPLEEGRELEELLWERARRRAEGVQT